MARKGGNPGLSEFQYKSERTESLSRQLTFRVGETMSKLLKEKAVEDWQELVRKKLAEALKEKGYNVPDY